MALSDYDMQQIDAALAREPAWKRRIIQASVDAFCEWLRQVLPGVIARIWNFVEDVFSSIFD